MIASLFRLETAMRQWLAILCVLPLLLSESALAQNVNDFLTMFGGVVQQAMRQAAQAEWQRVPPSETTCIDAALQQQGSSVGVLIQNGIVPNDPRVSSFRAGCRTVTGPLTSPPPDIQNLSSTPTFDCARARSLTARVVCLDQAGAAADWDLSSAYWARYFSIPESDRQVFDQAPQAWLDSLNQKCPTAQNQQQCVLLGYHKRAASYRSQLQGDALAESHLSPEQHAQIQQGLIALGVLNDTSDGEFGSKTRAAIKRFKMQSGAPESEFLTAEQRQQLLEGKATPLSNEARRSWQLIDVNVRFCVNRLLQAGGQSIDILVEHEVAASDPKVSAPLSECQKISSQTLLKNFDCVLDVGRTRCDEAFVLAGALTTPLTTEQVTTALLSHAEFGKAQIETLDARRIRIEKQKAMIADESLKKLKPLLDPDNKPFFGKATDLRKQIEDALNSPKASTQDMENLNASASDLLKSYFNAVDRTIGNPDSGEAQVSGHGSGATEKAAQTNAYYDIFEKQLRDLIGYQADRGLGQQFHKYATASFEQFKSNFFASATKHTCNKTGEVFRCSVEGTFKLDSLKSELQKLVHVATADNRFILGYKEIDDEATRFLIDKIRAEFVNSGYRIIARGSEEEAQARGEFDYYLNILNIEYDEASDVGSIGGAGTGLFENYTLEARVKLLDNKKDPVERQELANVSVINTKRVPRDAAMPREVRRNQLLPMQASELARQIYRDISARLLTLAGAQEIGTSNTGVLGPGHYSIKIVGLNERDREKIRALRNAVSKILPGTETVIDPVGTNDKSVEIGFEHTGKFDPEDLNDAIYDIFKDSKTFKVHYEGNNSFVGSL
jgi:uncharacterized protein